MVLTGLIPYLLAAGKLVGQMVLTVLVTAIDLLYQVETLKCDNLRDFDTVHSAAGEDGTTDGSVHLLTFIPDENKNIIPKVLTLTPVHWFSQREEMCNTDVGARYIKFDLLQVLSGIEINGGLLTQGVSNL